MSRRRNQSAGDKFVKNLRDYAVPVIGVLLLLVVLWNVFSGETATDNKQETVEEATNTNSAKMSLDFNADETQGFVEYSGGSKDKLAEKDALYPSEKLIVDSGDVTLQDGSGLLMKLNKNGELKYDSNGDFLLSSSDLFVKTVEPINMNLRFVSLVLPAGAIVSLNQNEVSSSVNVLSGDVQATSFAGNATTISSGEKLSISSVETTQKEYDITSKITDIGNYFFSETWAQENDLVSYLGSEDSDSETASGSTDTSSNSNKFISIEGIKDNQTYGESNLDISGEIIDDTVSRISFNGTDVTMNLVGKTYELKGFSIPLKENDVVYKAYDASGNVLERGIYTVYYSAGAVSTDTQTEAGKFPVTDSDPQFSFTAPSPNPYTSSESFITIRGQASAGVATSVSVNGLTLKSFNGTTWRYHAALQFGTLQNGVNLYKVNYFDASGKVLHTNTFTIIRKAPAVTPTVASPQTAASTTTSSTTAVDTSDSGGDSIGDRIPLE